MSNLQQDELLTWLGNQKDQAKKIVEQTKSSAVGDINTLEYYRGRFNAMLDIMAFIMTGGKLQ